MKNNKILKYIFFLVSAFCLFLPSLKAEEDYQFYCEYENIPKFGANASDKKSIKLRVYVYGNGDSKFYEVNDSKETEVVTKTAPNYGFVISDYSLKAEDFYKHTKKDGKNVCPNIGAKAGVSEIRGYKHNYYTLTFGDDNKDVNQYPSSGLTINPKLNNTDEGNDILNNTVTITHECSGKSLLKSDYENLRYNVEISLYMNSLGKKFVKIKYGNYYGEAEFDPVNGADIEVVYQYYQTGYQTIPLKDHFLFYGEDDSIIFSQDEEQIKNNTFTCPSVLPSIGIDKTSMSNSANGSIASQGGIRYTVAYSDEVAKAYGKDNTFHGTVDATLEDLFNFTIDDKPGFCVDYLGEASTEGTVANFLDGIFSIIKIGSIILVIVLSMLEFAQVTTKSKDELMAVVRKFVIRLVVLSVLLLLPTFIDMIGNIIGIEDILCGIK